MTNQPKAKWEPDARSRCWGATVGPYELNIDRRGWSVTHDTGEFEADGEFAGPVDTVTLMLAAESALAAHLRAVADTMTWPEAVEDGEATPIAYGDLRCSHCLSPEHVSNACPFKRGQPSFTGYDSDGSFADKIKPFAPEAQAMAKAMAGGLYEKLEALYPQAPSLCGHGCRAHSGSPSHDQCPQAAPMHVTREMAEQLLRENADSFKKILGSNLIETWSADQGVRLCASHNPLCNGLCDRVACNAFAWQAGYHGHQAQAATTDGYQMLIDRSSGAYIVTRGQSEVAKGSSPAWVNDGCQLAREAADAYERAKARMLSLQGCGYACSACGRRRYAGERCQSLECMPDDQR